MRNAIFWAIFYTIIAATLFICVIYGSSTSSGYKTSQLALIGAIIMSGVALYWIRKAVKHIFS
jgi:hypothetical protein